MIAATGDTWFLFQKYMRLSLRMPLWTLFGLVQPLIWLLLFGQLFSGMDRLPAFGGTRYIDYLTPGLLVMTVLFGSSWAGVSLLREITMGTVEKMLVTSVSRVAIVLSRVLHAAVLTLVQCAIILAAAALLSARLPSINGLIAAGLLLLLLAVGFASISNGLALLLRREEPLVVMGNMMTLPLMFFSTAFVPGVFLPKWMSWFATINPVQHAVEGVRLAFHTGSGAPLVLAIGVMGVFAFASLGWATSVFLWGRE